MMKAVKRKHKLPTEVVDALFLEIFKVSLDAALSSYSS